MAVDSPEAGAQARSGRGSFMAMGRALRHRNFRLFLLGQGISLIGTWLTRTATSWLAYRLTQSAWILGVVGFAGQIPSFILAPLGGVFVDSRDRHRVLLVTQALLMVQAALLAGFALHGSITVWHVLVLSVAQGIINAFDMPARQSFVVQMVDGRADLANAIALNSSMVNAARLLGPAVAGALIALFGEGLCFAIDAASYVAVLGSLWAMRLGPVAAPSLAHNTRKAFGEGLAYVRSFEPVRAVLLLMALVSLMGMPFTVLMPVFVDRTLGGGAHTLGICMAANGLGALGAALYLAARRSVVGLESVLTWSAMVFGVGLMTLSLCHTLWFALPVLVVCGGAMIMQMAASNTVLQTLVDDALRGRVMSFFGMAFFGMAPFGSLLAGALAERAGTPVTVAVGGICCVFGGLLFMSRLTSIRAQMSLVYQRLGIIPAIAGGVGVASDVVP